MDTRKLTRLDIGLTDQQIFDNIGDMIHDTMHYDIAEADVRSVAFLIYNALFKLPVSYRQNELFLEAFVLAIAYELKSDLFEYQINKFIDPDFALGEFPVIERATHRVAEELRIVGSYDFDVRGIDGVDTDKLIALIADNLSKVFLYREINMSFDDMVEIGVNIVETISEHNEMIDFENLELVNQIIRIGALSHVVDFLTMQFLMTGFQLSEYTFTVQNDTGFEIREIRVVATYVDEVVLIVYDDIVSVKNGESFEIEIAEPSEVDVVYNIIMRPVVDVPEGAYLLGGGILFYKEDVRLEPGITVVFTREDIVF
jgi:hypothetical protein